MERLLATDDVDEQVEILAFMKQSGFRPPTRGQGGPRRFVPRAGAPARTGPAARFDSHRQETVQTLPASIATAKDIRRLSANNPEWR